MALVTALGVVSVLLTGLSSVSMRLVRDSRAQIAADAAALAGVIGGESAAQRLAVMNGVVLCGYVNESVVAVRVCLGPVVAQAYAREQEVEEMPTLKP